MVSNDWIYFSLRNGLVDICDGLATFIKKWKHEFFFVDATVFTGSMCFGGITYRVSEPSPNLSTEEQIIVDRLTTNFVKWAGPDDEMLEMAGLGYVRV
ncbi:unnamed protein product [Lactuca virosa]|uniref:Uncharacterized protein n=1 Tax=Lactuca virosa TaxID=75947 RepID=A0AAU9PA12_9ASTR|nr:unnamed protein product [Lactuca virosa]